MTVHVRQSGIWVPARGLSVHNGGTHKRVRRAFVRQAGVWLQLFQDELPAAIVASASKISAQSYFSPEDWANPILDKRLIVNAVIGSDNPGIPALDAGTGRGGRLTIENRSQILGAGGLANSGLGGDAISVGQGGIVIENWGDIFGGGGGGGRAGNGGAGQYPYTHTEGPFNSDSAPIYKSMLTGSNTFTFYWAGVNVGTGFSPFTTGGWTYTAGWFGHSSISRSQTRQQATSGGISGNAGRGQGYDGVATVGAAAVAGGTGAGASGKSGDGGGWGESGQSGGNGADGNTGTGLAGATGGLAGRYIAGYANLISLINHGNVLGRVA